MFLNLSFKICQDISSDDGVIVTFYDNNINGRKVIDFGVATMVDISSEYRKKHYFVSVSTNVGCTHVHVVHNCDVYMYTKSAYIYIYMWTCFWVILFWCPQTYDVHMYIKFIFCSKL